MWNKSLCSDHCSVPLLAEMLHLMSFYQQGPTAQLPTKSRTALLNIFTVLLMRCSLFPAEHFGFNLCNSSSCINACARSGYKFLCHERKFPDGTCFSQLSEEY